MAGNTAFCSVFYSRLFPGNFRIITQTQQNCIALYSYLVQLSIAEQAAR